MANDANEAKRYLIYYFRLLAKKSGVGWDSDNEGEIATIVDLIIAATIEEAAIAQAAAAERQAAALERIADALDIMAHPNRIVAPDRQDYHQKEDYLEAVTQYDYAKNSRPGESMDEYKTRSAAEPY